MEYKTIVICAYAAQASKCKKWSRRMLLCRFPSSVHLRLLQEVEETTLSLCNALESTDGIIMGITEDVPMRYRQASCTTIMDNQDRHARENPKMYK